MQDRCVTYIYGYHESGRGENVGFVKLIRYHCSDGDNLEINIGIKNYSKETKTEYKIYFLSKESDSFSSDLLDEGQSIRGKNDMALFRYRVKWDNPCKTNKSISKYCGIVIVDDGEEIYAGFWKDVLFDYKKWILNNKRYENNNINNKKVNTEKYDENNKNNTPKIDINKENIKIDDKNNKEKVENKDLFENHDEIPVLVDGQIVKGVKISPRDIGQLSISNWHLGKNSFLNHGYFIYKYLLYGIVNLNGSQKCVIGVPSIYSRREKYLANMFGFRQFVPAKRCKCMAGNFGYWIAEVISE